MLTEPSLRIENFYVVKTSFNAGQAIVLFNYMHTVMTLVIKMLCLWFKFVVIGPTPPPIMVHGSNIRLHAQRPLIFPI